MSPKVSINILTKNRAQLLKRALASVARQTFRDFEVVIVDDGSTDETQEYLETPSAGGGPNKIQIINHQISKGITQSRQEALEKSVGEYVAILDDDDEWMDVDKLKKQVEFLDQQPDYVLVGGGVEISNPIRLGGPNKILNPKFQITKLRPETDRQIRNWMLIKNPFFTSTVMFRREAARKAGGFIKDATDLAEDYALWLRLGILGKMRNFQAAFALYHQSNYNREKFGRFLKKQLKLAKKHAKDYPWAFFARVLLSFRIFIHGG